MTTSISQTPLVAIACGGTGGHLFPGLAVARRFIERGCAVSLLVSPKDVDQQAVKSITDMEVVTLPAVALQRGSRFAFFLGFVKSWRMARKRFKARPPHAALAMGGFTSAPPVLAARTLGARIFLHESNTIPGRANRFLGRFVDRACVGFPETAERFGAKAIVTGTPVREAFQPRDAAECRLALDLDADLPVVLVMGGSQGASGINEMILSAAAQLGERAAQWQWLHLSGDRDAEKVRAAYTKLGLKAVVRPFLSEMELALGSATVAVSRAGASSLAELAAMRLPSLLVPYPYAADNHQFHNARAFEKSGSALLLEQHKSSPPVLAERIADLMENETLRRTMCNALAQWHRPDAAASIAEIILKSVMETSGQPGKRSSKPAHDQDHFNARLQNTHPA